MSKFQDWMFIFTGIWLKHTINFNKKCHRIFTLYFDKYELEQTEMKKHVADKVIRQDNHNHINTFFHLTNFNYSIYGVSRASLISCNNTRV